MYIYNCMSIYIHKYTYNAHAYRNIMYIVWIVQGVDNPGQTQPPPKYSKREYWAIEFCTQVQHRSKMCTPTQNRKGHLRKRTISPYSPI